MKEKQTAYEFIAFGDEKQALFRIQSRVAEETGAGQKFTKKDRENAKTVLKC